MHCVVRRESARLGRSFKPCWIDLPRLSAQTLQASLLLPSVMKRILNLDTCRAAVDGALKCSDIEAVEMSRYLLRQDGLFVGSSSAVNCVGAVKLAAQLPKGSRIVTLLCDGGQRHLSKFHNDEYLDKVGLTPKCQGNELDFIEY